MRIGLYGGTFDPVHHGHLLLAREALEMLALDQVVFIPAAISPHKLQRKPTSEYVRWLMIQAALEGEQGLMADDLELHRAGPSYTYDTVVEYRRRMPEAKFFYFIGSDNLAALDTWHRIDELLEMVTMVVLGRGEKTVTHRYLQVDRRFDVSATEIRNRVAKGLSIRYLVPERVAEIIRTQPLYQE